MGDITQLSLVPVGATDCIPRGPYDLLQQKTQETLNNAIMLRSAGPLQTQRVTVSMVKAMSHSLLY